MGEQLGEAILYLRTDDSGLNAGMSKAKAGAEDLGRTFTSAGGQAEQSLTGLKTSAVSAGAAATQMATSAQLSARAAVGLAGDAKTATVAVNGLGNGSALATRELLVLVREASRGNFTRMAGSASILTTALQGSSGGIKGLVTNLLTMFGVLQTTTNAELAAEAAAAGAAAEAVNLAATRSAANVAAADTELALAEASVRTAATSIEATAAQERLAAAHVAIAAAAAEAAIAEDALSVAEGRAAEAAAAAATTTRTSLTALGTGLGIITIAAATAFGAFKAFQLQVGDSGELDKFAEGLRLTTGQIEAAGGKVKYLSDRTQEVTGLTVTMGDVVRGVWKAIADHSGLDDSVKGLKQVFIDQFEGVLKAGVDTFAELYGDIVGTYRAAIVIWQNFPAALGDVFYSAVNAAIGAIDKLLKGGEDGVNGFVHSVNSIFGTKLGDVVAPQISQLTNQYSGAAKKVVSAIGVEVDKATAEAKTKANALVAEVERDILAASKKRLQAESDSNKPPKPPKPKKPNDHGAGEAMAELQAAIDGQYRLAGAYQVSDAAAVKAEALQKGEEDAIKHKSDTGVFYELELQKAVATRAAEGGKAIAQLRDEITARSQVNDMVAAGLVPASQMQQQLELEAKLRPLIVAYELADAQHKAALAAEIKNLTDAQAGLNAQTSRSQELQEIDANNDDIQRLQLQVSLIGASNRERAVALAQLEAEQKLKSMPGLTPDQQQAFIQSAKDKANAGVLSPFQQWAQSIPQDADAINNALEGIGTKGFDGLASAIAGVVTGSEGLKQAFGDVARSIITDLIEMTVKMLIFKALMAAFGSIGSGSIGSPDLSAPVSTGDIGGATPVSSLPGFSGGFATGGLIPAGMFGIVGEQGPEPIVATPKGAMVLPNSSLRQGMAANDRGPSVSVTNYNDFRGADAQAVGAISARVDQMERDLPTRVVTTMQNARSRFVWRG